MAKSKKFTSRESIRFLLDLRRKDDITEEEIKNFYKGSQKVSGDDPSYFIRLIKTLNDSWKKEKNKDTFSEQIIKLDIHHQLYNPHRPLENTFFFHLFADKFKTSPLIRDLKKLINSSETREDFILSTLTSLQQQYISSYPEAMDLGVEILGDLGFMHRLFQQTIHMLVKKQINEENRDAATSILLIMDQHLQEIDAFYSKNGLEYNAKPLADDPNANLICELTDHNIETIKNIGEERIKACKEITVKFNAKNINVDRSIETIKTLIIAHKWTFTGMNCASVYLLNRVLRENCVKILVIDDVAEVLFVDFVNNLTKCNSLTSLVLRNAEILKETMIDLFRGNPASLKEIIFENCKFTAILSITFDALQLNPNLEKLSLVGCSGFEAPCALSLLSGPFSNSTEETYSNLLKLDGAPNADFITGYYTPGDYEDIPECDEISKDLFYYMLHQIFDAKYKINTPDNEAGSLILWLKTIYKQITPKNQLSQLSDDQEVLLKSFGKFVKNDTPLKSEYAEITAKYCKALIAYSCKPEIADENPFLHELTKWMIDDICFQRGFRTPSECIVNSLSLNGVKLCEFSGAALAGILVTYKFLVNLDLGNNVMGDEGAAVIAAALPHNEGLVSLILSNNNITDEGAKAIAERLPHSKLKTLILNGNKITDLGAATLIKELIQTADYISDSGPRIEILQNSTLKKLDLNGNETTPDIRSDLIVLLGSNQTLESVTVNGENLIHMGELE